MPRINMEEIVEELDVKFERLLKTVVDEAIESNETDPKKLMHIFRSRIERFFSRWEYVPGRCVEPE